jgi:hypothetical protein
MGGKVSLIIYKCHSIFQQHTLSNYKFNTQTLAFFFVLLHTEHSTFLFNIASSAVLCLAMPDYYRSSAAIEFVDNTSDGLEFMVNLGLCNEHRSMKHNIVV